MSDSMEARYQALLENLRASHDWPSVYMFKFIVPADNQKIAKVEALFDTGQAVVKRRESSAGNFVSITATEMMLSPEQVVERYRMAEGIEGLVSL